MSSPDGNPAEDWHGLLQVILKDAEASAANAEEVANIHANPYSVIVTKGYAFPDGSVPVNGLPSVGGFSPVDVFAPLDCHASVDDDLAIIDGFAPVDGPVSANIIANNSIAEDINVFGQELLNFQRLQGGSSTSTMSCSQGYDNLAGPMTSGFECNEQQPPHVPIVQTCAVPPMSPPQMAPPKMSSSQRRTSGVVPPRGVSVDAISLKSASPQTRNLGTPSTSPESGPVAMGIPMGTATKKIPAKRSAARSKTAQSKSTRSKTTRSKASSIIGEMSSHQVLNSVHLPRALATAQEYSQHVSPFAPISPMRCSKAQPTHTDLDKARQRIKDLTNERSHYQRLIRQATEVDPRTGKTTLQILQAQNANLRRVNSTQVTKHQKLQVDLANERQKYMQLANTYNSLLVDFNAAQQENQEIKAQLENS